MLAIAEYLYMSVVALNVDLGALRAVDRSTEHFRSGRSEYALIAYSVSFLVMAHDLNATLYRGTPMPRRAFQAFHWAVVQPQRSSSPRQFDRGGSMAFTYTSIGKHVQSSAGPCFPSSRIFCRGQDLASQCP